MKRFLTIAIMGISAVAIAQDTPFPTGCTFDEAAYKTQPRTAPLRSGAYVDMPHQISLRAYCPRPHNQSPYNTCVGWAVAYGSFTIIEAMAANRTADDITENAFSPSYLYNQIREGDNCMSPAFIHKAIEILTTKGCVRLKDFPFDCDREIAEIDDKKALASRELVAGYKALTPYKDLGLDQVSLIKKSLSQKNPVVLAMKCYDSFQRIDKTGVWNGVEDKYLGYHALVVVGYDDDQYGGAFEVLNSWGTGWANGGFAWVKYNDMLKTCAGAYEITKNPSFLTPTNVTTDHSEYPYSLAGSLRLEKDSGEPMLTDFNPAFKSYVMRQGYRSGSRFRMYVNNHQPAYVYTIGYDLSNKTFQIFPYKENMSAALTYSDNEIALPSEKSYIKLDGQEGTDYLCVLFSRKPIDVQDFSNLLEKGDGSFRDKLKKALGNRILDPGLIKYDKDKIGFEAFAKDYSIAVLMLEIDHMR